MVFVLILVCFSFLFFFWFKFDFMGLGECMDFLFVLDGSGVFLEVFILELFLFCNFFYIDMFINFCFDFFVGLVCVGILGEGVDLEFWVGV